MRRVELAPVLHKDEYSAEVERPILEYFRETIYGPLLAMLKEAGIDPKNKDQGTQGNFNAKRIENARGSPVANALEDGRLWYANGTFTGKFNAAISQQLRQMGATFDVGRKVFTLAESALPNDVKSAVVASTSRSTKLHDQMALTLDEMQRNAKIAKLGLDVTRSADRITADLQKQFVRSVTGVESLTAPAEITPQIAREMAKSLDFNLDLYIKDFVLEQIPELRQRVQQNLFAGGRADRLAKIVEASYGVSKRKAAFLAENETSLAVSKFRELRYKEIGSQNYRWATSHDSRVRHEHRLLDGKIYSWDAPPPSGVNGEFQNPGVPIRCRCRAIPILVFPDSVTNAKADFRCIVTRRTLIGSPTA